MRVGLILSSIFWVVIAVVCSSCTYTGALDWIEDGSRMQATYERNRYSDIRTGMHFAARPEQVPIAPIPGAGGEYELVEKQMQTSPHRPWYFGK